MGNLGGGTTPYAPSSGPGVHPWFLIKKSVSDPDLQDNKLILKWVTESFADSPSFCVLILNTYVA